MHENCHGKLDMVPVTDVASFFLLIFPTGWNKMAVAGGQMRSLDREDRDRLHLRSCEKLESRYDTYLQRRFENQ